MIAQIFFATVGSCDAYSYYLCQGRWKAGLTGVRNRAMRKFVSRVSSSNNGLHELPRSGLNYRRGFSTAAPCYTRCQESERLRTDPGEQVDFAVGKMFWLEDPIQDRKGSSILQYPIARCDYSDRHKLSMVNLPRRSNFPFPLEFIYGFISLARVEPREYQRVFGRLLSTLGLD